MAYKKRTAAPVAPPEESAARADMLQSAARTLDAAARVLRIAARDYADDFHAHDADDRYADMSAYKSARRNTRAAARIIKRASSALDISLDSINQVDATRAAALDLADESECELDAIRARAHERSAS